MYRSARAAFTLVELLVVIAVIAILATILFPVLSQVRERARMGACASNMLQIGHAMHMYVADYDETYPYARFRAPGMQGHRSAQKGMYTYVWKNAIRPYLSSIDVFACPTNPLSRTVPGMPCANFWTPLPGENGEGWEMEETQRMPISYGLNTCATTLFPADSDVGRAYGPLRHAQVVRPAQTIQVAETQLASANTQMDAIYYNNCSALFAHSTGAAANFLYFDGHVKSKKWLSTLYPLNENNWQLSPYPDPNNRKIEAPPGCPFSLPPPTPEAREFQTPQCRAYR